MSKRVKTGLIIFGVIAIALISRLLYVGLFDLLIGFISIIGCVEVCVMFTRMGKFNSPIIGGMYPVLFYFIFQLGTIFKLSVLQIVLMELALVVLLLTITFFWKIHSNAKYRVTATYKLNIFNSLKYMWNTFLVMIYPGLCFISLFLINNFEFFIGLPQKISQISFVMLFLVLSISSLSDIFAYYIGSKIRGPKLAPKISPNKTISGAIGGLVGGVIASLLIFGVISLIPAFSSVSISIWWFVLIGLVGSVVGQAGDLFESFIKRKAGLKDSGTFFPGHGGMMDRVDNMCFLSIFVLIMFICIL